MVHVQVVVQQIVEFVIGVVEAGGLLDEFLPVQEQLVVLGADFVEDLPHLLSFFGEHSRELVPEPLFFEDLLLLLLVFDLVLLFLVLIEVADVLLLVLDELLQEMDHLILVVHHDDCLQLIFLEVF